MIVKIESRWRNLLEQRGSIRAITHQDLFDAVRGDWKINVNRANNAACILVVARGLVRDVVKPTGWEPSTVEGKKRMAGEQDATAYRGLVEKSVVNFFGRGAQTAVRYLNC